MMDEVKMTLSIKSSSKLLNDAHGNVRQSALRRPLSAARSRAKRMAPEKTPSGLLGQLL